jgi:hypothetical protein
MILSAEEFHEQFCTAERSVMRLEMRRHTNIPTEQPELRAFLAGERPEQRGWDLPSWWTDMVSVHKAAGHVFRRVRVMDNPLTDYNRFMIWSAPRNVEAGEDIRFLAMADGNKLDLPDHDFWVYDSARLVELRFTDDGRVVGYDLFTDLDSVARQEEWINRAFAAATPYADYVAEDPTRAWPPVRLEEAAKGA